MSELEPRQALTHLQALEDAAMRAVALAISQSTPENLQAAIAALTAHHVAYQEYKKMFPFR